MSDDEKLAGVLRTMLWAIEEQNPVMLKLFVRNAGEMIDGWLEARLTSRHAEPSAVPIEIAAGSPPPADGD